MIFDLVASLLFLFALTLGYRYGTSVELYRLAKIFLVLSVATTKSSDFGVWLTQIGFLKANDWAVLTLTGFLSLFMMFWGILHFIESIFVASRIHRKKKNRILGMALGGFQAVVLISFGAFMSTQLAFVKESYKGYLLKESIFYIHMDRACRKIVTAHLVESILNNKSEAPS